MAWFPPELIEEERKRGLLWSLELHDRSEPRRECVGTTSSTQGPCTRGPPSSEATCPPRPSFGTRTENAGSRRDVEESATSPLVLRMIKEFLVSKFTTMDT